MDKLTYKYYRKNGGEKAYIVIHGSGPVGVETGFITSIFDAIAMTKNSVICFNFPYCDRGEDNSSGAELEEEVASLKCVVDFIRSERYKNIGIVAKSLGGIVASYYLERYPDNKIDLAILGFIPDDVKRAVIKNNLKLVIQGENDRFASPSEIEKIVSNSAKVVEIKNADHSYRNDKKEPIYQNLAIEKLIEWIEK